MRLVQAIDGFLLFKEAAGLRRTTIENYRYVLGTLFVDWRGDPPLDELTADDINRFLLYLRTDYRPKRPGGDDGPLSSQSVYNAWVGLKSFVRPAHETLDIPDVMTGRVPRPRAANKEQYPFTEDEMKRLLTSIKPRKGARATSGLYYATDLRDLAIVMTLVDSGVRARELCNLTIADVHLQSGQVTVVDGKGGKMRQVWIGAKTRAAVWRYLQERATIDPAAPLFSAEDDRPMNHRFLFRRLKIIGQRADVANVNPHRFRYTFAVQYLRNGGDVFTLQRLLGHTTMAMVNRYLKLAQADLEQAHRRASPVDNWLK